jgi:hypothetical protein
VPGGESSSLQVTTAGRQATTRAEIARRELLKRIGPL